MIRWLWGVAVALGFALAPTACGATTPVAEPGLENETVPDGAQSVAAEVIVERVIDGDSLELLIDGEPVETRLLGINAPELRSLAGSETCDGTSARGEMEALVDAASTVAFVPDELDRFGRQLGVLVLDDVPVTESMVEAGWALALWSGENERLSELMQTAAGAGRGMWGPTCGEPALTELEITEIHADAPGDDRYNLTEEWATVTNQGETAADLEGWTIRDETTSNRFTISQLVLEPGDFVRFRSGRGSTGGADYFLGEDFPVWSNRGETAMLVDPDGRITAYAFSSGS